MSKYNEVLDYLKIASARGSKLGLERTTELCERLGNPQEKTKIIHVAGTNGKGSFCTMLSAILHESGYRVGGFSSPALTEVTDSFRIDCKELPKSEFAELMSDIIPLCEEMDDKPTEFEVLTASAYELFRRYDCDVAVVECGMGGDTDSTNVISSPVLSVITNIAIDHTAFLGGTIQEIASHKAGIIKPQRPVLYGGNNAEALEVIRKTAEENNSPLSVTNHSRISVVKSDISELRVKFDSKNEYSCSLVGEYQAYNVANVLTAVELLRNEGFNIPEEAVERGLAKARIHGRFEVFSLNPPIIFDGSHNPDGIIKMSESIKKYFGHRKVALLIGVMADKDYELYPEYLADSLEYVCTVKPDNPRALDPITLALAFNNHGITAYNFDDDLSGGISFAIRRSIENNIPLVALGSLYMYKDFIRILNQYNLP